MNGSRMTMAIQNRRCLLSKGCVKMLEMTQPRIAGPNEEQGGDDRSIPFGRLETEMVEQMRHAKKRK